MTKKEYEIVGKLLKAAWRRDEKHVAVLLMLLGHKMRLSPLRQEEG